MNNDDQTLNEIHTYCNAWLEEVTARAEVLKHRLIGVQKANPDNADKYLTGIDSELAKVEDDILVLRTLISELPPQRIEDENQTLTWGAYVERMEQDPTFKDDEAYLCNLFALGAAKCRDELMQYHSFIDGTVDRCILNEHSIMLD